MSFPLIPKSAWAWHASAAVLILLAAGLHVAYLTSGAALDLAPDEAHYWDWSRHLDWSYYSKGPLVAYLIRLGCELFGGASVALTGTPMLAVRLPAVLCGSLFLLSLYVLTARVTGREKLAFLVISLALLASPEHRGLLARRGFWGMVGVTALCCLPILIWNSRNDWVTFRHVGGQAGLDEERGIRWLGPLNFVALQFVLLLGFWFVFW